MKDWQIGIVITAALYSCGSGAFFAHAQNLDGTLSSGFYGSALAVQTINTGFGNAPGGDDSSYGSELDAAYGKVSGGNLYLFFSGNLENNGNHLNIFVDGGAAGGQNTLSLPGPGMPGPVMAYMNGSVFSPGFNATFALDLNDYAGTLYSEEYNVIANTGGYVGSLAESGTGVAAGNSGGVANLYLNNTHASTMGASGTALAGLTSGAAANTGLELVLPLSAIGWGGGSIKVLAAINGSYPADTYLSNQFLPGLAVGTDNVGGGSSAYGSGGVFNFGDTPGEYFTISVPEPSSLALIGLSGLALVIRRRAQ